MNELDYAIVAIVFGSLLIGIWRGAIREIVNIAGWVIAFFVAQSFAPELKNYLAEWMADPSVRMVVAWLAVFLIVMIAVSVLGSLISEGVRKLGLGMLDRALGAVVGALRGGLIVLLLTLAAGLTTFPKSPIWKDAALTQWLETMALYVRSELPESLAKRITYDRPKAHQSAALAPRKGS
jgi:membrane protein required for colicin V production